MRGDFTDASERGFESLICMARLVALAARLTTAGYPAGSRRRGLG